MKPTTESRRYVSAALRIGALAAASAATAAELNVPADHATIQAAVNKAANGDTIRIASGVYPEQVRILSKRLTLVGQPGTILRATENMVPFGQGALGHYAMLGTDSSDISVRGLTFEGERLAGHYVGAGDLEGIFGVRSSVNVEDCRFYGFRESTVGLESGDPIWLTASDDTDIRVRVVGCTFADNYGGILLLGSRNRQSITITIENNTILGLGPVATSYNYSGIELGAGVGGRIAGNTISGFSYIGTSAEFPISVGIAASDNPAFSTLPALRIEGNTLRDNQMHIALIKASGSVIRNNRFLGTSRGIVPLGIAVSGTSITIAENQFDGLPEGIRLLGQDPLAGSIEGLEGILGFAVNARVTNNSFCNVATPILRQPPATAVESGTSVGNCVTNPLTISPGVLVSWPAGVDDWTVESASNANGPWSASNLARFRQNGHDHVAMPAEEPRRFFRLLGPGRRP